MTAHDPLHPHAVLRDPVMLARMERNVRAAGVSRRRFLAFAAAVSGTAALAACGESAATPTAAPTVAPTMSVTPTKAASPVGASSVAPASTPTMGGATVAPITTGAPIANAMPTTTTSPTMATTSAMTGGAKPGVLSALPPSLNASKPDSKKVHFDYLTSEPTDNDFNRDLYCNGAEGAWAWLLQYDADYNVLPDIAESYTIGADGKTYTMKLRKGVQWSDGMPMKASDFVYSFKRAIDPRTGNGYSSFWDFVVKGAKEFSNAKTDDPNLDKLAAGVGVSAPDDSSFVLTGDIFAALIPSQLAFFAAAPAREDLVKKYADAKGVSSWTDPSKTSGPTVTSGPYIITNWKHNVAIDLVRNDKYWNAASVKQKYVSLKILPDINKSTLPYENGDVDYQIIPSTEVDRFRNDPKFKGQVFQFVNAFTRFLVPDTGHAPFDKLEVRKATILAIDKERLVNQVGKKVHTIAYAMTAPGVFGYYDDDDNKLKNLQKYDKAAAMDALKGTTFEGGRNWPKVTLSYNVSDSDIPTGYPDEIARQLKENIGMQVDIEPLDQKVWNQRRFALDLQMLLYRWGQDYPDPHDQYYLVWSLHAKGAARQSYTDPVFDDLAIKGGAETDRQKRLDVYYQAETRLQTQYAYMPIHWRNDFYAIKPYLTNVPKNKQGYVVFNTSGIFNRAYDSIYVTDDSPHDPPK